MDALNLLSDLLLMGLMGGYLYIAPYSKVEESFNTQAIYDLLRYGVQDISQFDHNKFPGVVQRTFVGDLIIAFFVNLSNPQRLVPDVSLLATQINLQYVARGFLGLINVMMIIRVRNSLVARAGYKYKYIGLWYSLLQLVQFHIVFYSSRFLPNFFALPLANFALSQVLLGEYTIAFILLGFSGVCFRLEVGLFGGVLSIFAAFYGESKLIRNILFMIVGVVIGVVVSGSIDSYFWNELTLPEFSSFLFNIIDGKSVEWGVEPFGAYFTKYFKSIFFPPHTLVLSLAGLIGSEIKVVKVIGVSSFVFVTLMSFQPHKEWRFIIYAIPGITLLGANGAAVLTNSKSHKSKLFAFIFVVSSLISLVGSIFMAFVSSLNYPGGVALKTLNDHIINTYASNLGLLETNPLSIHLDIPAKMTGVTLFGELTNPYVIYDKDESDDLDMSKFNYWISEKIVDSPDWNREFAIPAYDGINLSLLHNKEKLIGLGREVLESKSLMCILDDVIIMTDKMFIYKREKSSGTDSLIPESSVVVEEIINEDMPDSVISDFNEAIDEIVIGSMDQ